MSYDTIGQEVLEEIKKAEAKVTRRTILSLFEQDEEKPSPGRRTPPPRTMTSPITPNQSSTHSTPVSTSNSNVIFLPPELIKKEKKALRTGRKKVNITTTGEIEPITPPRLPDPDTALGEKGKSLSGISTVETLDQIMMELERKEAEKEMQHKAVEIHQHSGKTNSQENRYLCCFRKKKITN